jgi:hypothetical protein
MKITVWTKDGYGTELTGKKYAYIEVDGKTVWNTAALQEKDNNSAVALWREAMDIFNKNTFDFANWFYNNQQRINAVIARAHAAA